MMEGKRSTWRHILVAKCKKVTDFDTDFAENIVCYNMGECEWKKSFSMYTLIIVFLQLDDMVGFFMPHD